MHPGCSSVSQLAGKVGCRRGGGQESNSRPCALHPKPGSKTVVRQGLWVELRDRQGPLCLSATRTGGAELSVCSSCPQAQKAKFLSDAENELEELAVTIAQARKMVELIKVTLRWLRVGEALLGWGVEANELLCGLEGGTGRRPSAGPCTLSPQAHGVFLPVGLCANMSLHRLGHERWWSSEQLCPARALGTWIVTCCKLLGEGVSEQAHRSENWLLARGQGCSPAGEPPAGGDPNPSLPAFRAPLRRRGKKSRSSLQKPQRSWQPSIRR